MMMDDLHKIQFRGLQSHIFEDSVKIIAPMLNMDTDDVETRLMNAVVVWQIKNKSPIAPVRLKSPDKRKACVADILGYFKEELLKGSKSRLSPGIVDKCLKDVMEHFVENYMYQDDWY
jgi:hypothetical protein